MHKKYADSKNSQCTCDSATFLAFLHELKNLQSADLDLVLDRGHAMYALTLRQLIADGRHVHTHLNTEEIPEVVLGYRQQHVMETCDPKFGLFTAPPCNDHDGDKLKFAARLQCLSSEVSYALLILNSLCIAVFRDQQGRYGFFDPHSRRPDGSPFGPFDTYQARFGKAVMFIYTGLTDLITKIVTFFEKSGTNPKAQYELLPVIFHNVDELSVDENLAHADSNADVITDLNPMSSVTQAESETSVPSCSVTQSTVCVDSTPDVNELMHVTTSKGAVEYPTSDTTKHNNEHVPDLSKYSRQEKRWLKKRALAMGKKKVTQTETATYLPSCSVTVGSDADITVSHMREQDRETMSSITQAEAETSLPSCSVTECTPCGV
ncbi:uncharacterized protein LOC126389346 [Epinephelus moara]|uniref:uncharacterized protein LOC126389346 n=1 Tax=Epinephelus moara TaxID=300413 RepID=UPI00214E6CB0|nr:uncharacterized protein LOC126389346 [Epinephelus moara]